jgi:1-acyl-sn-glycerol-3-phosphate acyltransferase
MPISREAAGTESLRESLRRIEAGYLVGVFPEGTRTADGRLGVLKPGFIALLRRANCPIVPVGIAGAFEAYPRKALVPRPGKVRVVFGEPIAREEFTQFEKRGSEPALLQLIRARIEECSAQAEQWRANAETDCPVD